MLKAIRARLIDDAYRWHRLWSMRVALFWAVLSALYTIWPSFQSYISPALFAGGSAFMAVALAVARILRQDKLALPEPEPVPAPSAPTQTSAPEPAPTPAPEPAPTPEPVPLPRPRPKGGMSAAAVALCVGFLGTWEGYEPVAKHEAVDPPGVITWCMGRTNYDDPAVKAGTRFTKAQCDKFLADDIPRYTIGVRKCVPGFDDMPASRQVSLVSFAYNLGNATLCRSHVAYYLNRGDVKAGCDDMLLYVHANGHYLQGLHNRRVAERALCLKDQ